MQTVLQLVTVLLIALSCSEVTGARSGEDRPIWAEWLGRLTGQTRRPGFGNTPWESADNTAEPESRRQEFGRQRQRPYNQFGIPFGPNQFGQIPGQFQHPPFGGNPFGQFQRPGFEGNQFNQNQRPDQFGENQFGQTQRPGQFGGNQNQFNQNQRPDQFGGNQFGQNQRPGEFGGNQFGQNQRPNQFEENQFSQNQRPNENGGQTGSLEQGGENQFNQNQRPEQNSGDQFNQQQQPGQTGGDWNGQTQRPVIQTDRPTPRPTERPSGESKPGNGQSVNRQLQPGESCTRDNIIGKCTRLYDCVEVVQGIQQNRPPPMPCYVPPGNPVPYVCCLDQTMATPPPAPADPNTPKSTIRPTQVGDRLAKRRCREYAKLVMETEVSPALFVGPDITVDKCVKAGEGLIVGGVDATLGEFPHMALLGYGDDPNSLSYDCGGSLISDQYVLTASHCIAESTPTYVLLGELILRNDNDNADPQLIPIASDGGIIPHPQYRYPSHYFDIALILLSRRPTLGPLVRPACLHTGEPFSQGSLIASGWGRTDFGGDASDNLMKVNLNMVDVELCNKTYRNLGSKLVNGIRSDQQICAGQLEGGKDTCQGDSGGPLQVFRTDPHCTYDIVGIVSFGKGCALRNTPAVYTRVENFVDWIESVIWPPSSRSGEPESSD